MKQNLNRNSRLGLFCAVATLAVGAGNILAQGFPGIGGLPGFGGGTGGGGGGRGGNSTSVATAARVSAVADEHSNSVIVSGSEDQLKAIEALIKQLDTDVLDLTELQVFALTNADPDEMAAVLTSIFPDPTTNDTDNRGGATVVTGGVGGFGNRGGGGRGAPASTTSSERTLKKGKVLAVADQRTRSIVVSAAKQLMPQIAAMVMQLDSNPAKKKKVRIYTIENGNVEDIGTALKSVYETSNTRSTTTTTGNNALTTRQNQSTQNQSTTSGANFGGGTGGGTGGR